MSKLAPTSTKYVIKATIKANGIVDKPDVIGAVFGQTEGLLGADLDLRELQRTGKIGRIEVKVKSEKGTSEGQIIIPSSLSASETSLIAATLETIERVGPCTATITLDGVEDAMEQKRKQVIEKAKGILKNIIEVNTPDTEEISEHMQESIRTEEITSYQGLPAGPGLMESESIVIVEGRADVINLLKYGIRNTIGVEGTSIPKPVAELSKEKEATVLVDGDRGGQLIIRELLQVADIDFIATAPDGKEIEDCTKKEIFKALRDKVTVEQFKLGIKNGGYNHNVSSEPAQSSQLTMGQQKETLAAPMAEQPKPHSGFVRRFGDRVMPDRKLVKLKTDQKKLFKKTLDELVGTRAACILNEKNELMGRVPVKELGNIVRTIENPHTIIFDGKVGFEIESVAKRKGVKFLVGMEKENMRSPITILDKADLE